MIPHRFCSCEFLGHRGSAAWKLTIQNTYKWGPSCTVASTLVNPTLTFAHTAHIVLLVTIDRYLYLLRYFFYHTSVVISLYSLLIVHSYTMLGLYTVYRNFLQVYFCVMIPLVEEHTAFYLPFKPCYSLFPSTVTTSFRFQFFKCQWVPIECYFLLKVSLVDFKRVIGSVFFYSLKKIAERWLVYCAANGYAWVVNDKEDALWPLFSIAFWAHWKRVLILDCFWR